jgi:hypothetical protein
MHAVFPPVLTAKINQIALVIGTGTKVTEDKWLR